jgi:hypothetical protein
MYKSIKRPEITENTNMIGAKGSWKRCCSKPLASIKTATRLFKK